MKKYLRSRTLIRLLVGLPIVALLLLAAFWPPDSSPRDPRNGSIVKFERDGSTLASKWAELKSILWKKGPTQQSDSYRDGACGAGVDAVNRCARIPVASMDTVTGPLEVVAGEVLVRFADRLSQDEQESVARSLGSQILSRGKYTGMVRLKVPPDSTISSFLLQLSARDDIATSQANAITRAASVFDDDGQSLNYEKQWNLERIGYEAVAREYGPDLNLSAVKVAVLDTGVAYQSGTFDGITFVAANDLGHSAIVPGYDFIAGDALPLDEHQHGTHIAGVIAGNGGAEGVSPGVSILPVRVLDGDAVGSELALAEGIAFASEQGADIINMSLVLGDNYFPSQMMTAAVTNAYAAGALLVAAAGNCGEEHTHYPAAFDQVIGVGATRLAEGADGNKFAREYSDRGAHVEVLCPGGANDRDANHDNVPDGILAQSISPGNPSKVGYWLMSGTSQATAHATGILAWLRALGMPQVMARAYLKETVEAIDKQASAYHNTLDFGMTSLERTVRVYESAEEGQPMPPEWLSSDVMYVNLSAVLAQKGTGIRGVAVAQVFGEDGEPAPGVTLIGQVVGTAPRSFTIRCDADGRAWIYSDTVPNTGPVAFGVEILGIVDNVSPTPIRPIQYYYLTEGMQHAMTQLLADPVVAAMGLVFYGDADDASLQGVFNKDLLIDHYLFQPVGAWDNRYPTAIVFNPAYMAEMRAAMGGATETRELLFEHEMAFGFWPSDHIVATLLASTNPNLPGLVVLPVDTGFIHGIPGYHTPVFNLARDVFVSEQGALIQGFISSALGTGFISSALQTGFISSALGTGFISSALGTGFISSALGTGFISSALGTGIANQTIALSGSPPEDPVGTEGSSATSAVALAASDGAAVISGDGTASTFAFVVDAEDLADPEAAEAP